MILAFSDSPPDDFDKDNFGVGVDIGVDLPDSSNDDNSNGDSGSVGADNGGNKGDETDSDDDEDGSSLDLLD